MNNELLFPKGPARARTITLEDGYWDFAKSLGRGKVSQGIRIALYKAFVAEKEDTKEVDIHTATKRSTLES